MPWLINYLIQMCRRIRQTETGESRCQQSEYARTDPAVQQIRIGAGAQRGSGQYVENEIGEKGERSERHQEALSASESKPSL